MHYRPPHLYCRCLTILLVAPTSAVVQASEAPRVEQPNDVAYWDAVYSESVRAGVKTFAHSWQGVDLETLRGVLKLKVQPHERYIVLGAGDSGLPEELFDAGCRHVTAVDFSTKLVRAMAERSHGVLWRLEDARKLSFAEASFDVVLDMGLLDSVVAGGDEQVAATLSEVHRVLAAGGIYVSVSTEPPLYRLPSFVPLSTGKDGWDTKVLFIPRVRSLDPRVRRIDPALDMDKLSVYVSVKGSAFNGTENGTEVLSVEPGGMTIRVSGDAASAAQEQSEVSDDAQLVAAGPPAHRRRVETAPSTMEEGGSSLASEASAETQLAEPSDNPEEPLEAAPRPEASAEAKPAESAGKAEEPSESPPSAEATAEAKPATPAGKPEEPSETVPSAEAAAEAKLAEPAVKPEEPSEIAPSAEASVKASAEAEPLAKPEELSETAPGAEASAEVKLADPAGKPEGPSETSQSAETKPAEPAETAS